MPDPNPDPGTGGDLGSLMDLLPLDILEAVIISNLKVFGEQPAIEALLDLSGKVAEQHFQTQNLINQQSVLHNLTVAGTVKCLEMVGNIDATSEEAPQKLMACLDTISSFKLPNLDKGTDPIEPPPQASQS